MINCQNQKLAILKIYNLAKYPYGFSVLNGNKELDKEIISNVSSYDESMDWGIFKHAMLRQHKDGVERMTTWNKENILYYSWARDSLFNGW